MSSSNPTTSPRSAAAITPGTTPSPPLPPCAGSRRSRAAVAHTAPAAATASGEWKPAAAAGTSAGRGEGVEGRVTAAGDRS